MSGYIMLEVLAELQKLRKQIIRGESSKPQSIESRCTGPQVTAYHDPRKSLCLEPEG
jgi:hypothetical protein